MNREKFAFLAFILGIVEVGLGIVFIPVFPFIQLILSPFVLIFGILGLKSQRKILAIIGMILMLFSIIHGIILL